MRAAMAVECGAAHAAMIAERVAVAALLVLEHQRTLSFERRAVLQICGGGWIAGPGLHDGTPRRVGAQVRKDSESDGDDGDHQHRNGAARPVFFAFTGDERKQQHSADDEDRER